MGLLGRIVRALYSQTPSDNAPSCQDPASERNQLSLTLSFRHGNLRLDIGPSARSDSPERPTATAGTVPMPRQDADGGPQLSPRPQRTSVVSFWDALEPTEREGLRAVASLRTFAAGATIMQEGRLADHVIVILGGKARICVSENAGQRTIAERGLGQLIGEGAALEVTVRSATVVVVEMIWALVVQTKDFAAFISTHPRVLALVEEQRYDRGTDQPTGFEPDIEAPANYRIRRAARMATREPEGLTVEQAQPLNGENCTVILSDVVAFGARTRTDRDRLIIRAALSRMTKDAIQDLPGMRSEDRGDGILTVIPPKVSTAEVMDRLLNELPYALDRHNCSQRESARFQLRLAINVGPVVSDAMGVSGEAIIVAARLVEAPRLKEAIATSTANLGVIASPFVYEAVIRHGSDPNDVASYSQVPVEVKESATMAWMKLLDPSVASPVASRATVSDG
jgi:hypothetical protein